MSISSPTIRGSLRPALSQALPWLLALAVATCTQDRVGPSDNGVGYFSFKPVYQLAGGASLGQFGIVADTVRIRITRPVDQLVLDTAVAFPADSSSLRLALPITLITNPELLDAVITISAQGSVIFLDSVQVQVVDGPPGSTTPPTVVFEYVGPGSNIASVDVTPNDTTVFLGDTLFFAATALDSVGGPVTTFYLNWKTSDTAFAKVNAGGRLIAPVLRGSVDVVATTPTGIADTTTVTFAPVPVIVTADSGAGQSGLVGDSLAALFVARVKGADSLGIAGVGVRFTAVTAGGAVRDTLVLTDANGRARTRALLGTGAGVYTYTAAVVGTPLPTAAFLATATPSVASSIAILSGNAQTDTIGKTLTLPLTVEVRDGFNNVVAGATVVFTRAFGLGLLADDSVVTNGSGVASVGYTLGVSVGTDTIRALLAGTSAFVNFTATAVSATPTTIVADSGDLQSAVVALAFADSLVVRVTDAGANPVPGVTVLWDEETGSVALSGATSLTGADGRARIGVTAGTVAGSIPVLATIAGLADTVTFTLTLLPGAPASMTIASGNAQTGVAGVALPLWPEVRIGDGFNNPIAGLTVNFAVVAGGGTIDSATATTDSTGRANSGAWTLGLAGLNTVRAVTAAVPADTLLFDATAIPAGTTKTWTAAVNNSWALDSNWSPIGQPTTLDNVFVPSAPPSPVVPLTTGIRDLTIESGATVTLAAITLNVSRDADITGNLAGTGTLNLTGTGTSFRGNTSTALVLVNGTPALSGPTSVTGPLTINAGFLAIGGQSLAVSGALTVQGSGQLVMTATGDSVDVGGNLTYSNGVAGTGSLSTGVLVLRGNFTQATGASNNFQPSGTHTTRFLGAGTQTVLFATPSSATSRFQNVEFGSPAGTIINSTVTVMGTVAVSAGTVTGIGRTVNIGGALATPYAAWQVSNTLWGQDPSSYPDSLPRNVTVFNGWTLTKPFKTDSNLVVNNTGVLALNGNTLLVGGSLSQSGVLRMQNAADTLDVGGAFAVNSGISGTGDLSAGVLVLRGSFTQLTGASNNFQPGGTHRTRFLGSAAQTVSFSTASAATSRFNDVEFGNAAGVTLSSSIYTAGPASVTAGTVTGIGRTASFAGDLVTPYASWQVSTTTWVGTPAAHPDSLPRHVIVAAPMALAHSFKVDSNFTITSTGSLDLSGSALRIGGAFTQSGELLMLSTADTLDVAGLFAVNSGQAGTGDLTAGLLRLRGGFSQSTGASNNFQATGTHLTRFEAGTGQSASFSTSGASTSHFNVVEIADSVSFGSSVHFPTGVTFLGSGRAFGAGTGTIVGDLNDPTNLGWRYASTIFAGTVGNTPDSLVTNLTITGNWTLSKRVRVTGSLAITGTGVLDLNGDTLLVGAMTQSGTLLSSVPSALLDVGGNFSVNSGLGGVGSLTEGRLTLRNGFAQTTGASNNFAPTVNFVTGFVGTGGHAVSFSSGSVATSRFHHLTVSDSLTLGSAIGVTGDLTLDPAGRIRGPAQTAVLLGDLIDPSGLGWRVLNTSIPGGRTMPDSLVTNLSLTGAWTLPVRQWIDGAFTITSTGALDLGAQRLDVSGTMTQSGELRMLQPEDTLAVAGQLTVNSGQSGVGDMIDGALLLGGGLSQLSGASNNFAPAAGHLTWFIGTGGQPVSFSSSGLATSHFGNLIVSDSLTLASAMAVAGQATVDSGHSVNGAAQTVTLGASLSDDQVGWKVGTTTFAGRFSTLPAVLVSNVVLQDSTFLGTNITVTGDFTLQANAYLGMGGHGLGVSGNFTQAGHLPMFATGDSLEVGGNFLVNSGQSSAGDLVAGVIVLHGGFSQQSGASNNFVGTSPHRVRFTGASGGNVGFSSPTVSMFGDLEVDGPGALTLTSDLRVLGTFTVAGGASTLTSASNQRLLRAGALAVDGLTLDRVRVKMNSPAVNAAQFDNVTFTNIDPTLTQLSLELPGQTGDTLKFNNVAFSGTPTTGRYLFVADSVANDAAAIIGFYNSTPLNGALFTAVEGTVGDPAIILWTHLEWQIEPSDGVELLAIAPAPQVRAVDPSGVLVPGYTGTVTLAFFTDPTGGLASLAGNSVAAVGGVATFDSLTVSVAGLGFQLRPSSPDLGEGPPSRLFGISLPLPVGTTTAFNNGAGDNDWFNAANWTFGVPDSLDNVYIQPGQTVTVNAPAELNRLVVGVGAGIVLNAPLVADSSVAAGNTITGGGILTAQGSGTLNGVVGDLYVTGAYAVPAGGHLTAQSVVITATGVLDPGLDTLTVIDSLVTGASGVLNVSGATAIVDIGGDARFGGGTSTLNDGLLILRRGLSTSHPTALTSTPTFDLSIQGTGTQAIVLAGPDSTNALPSILFAGDTLQFLTSAWVAGNLNFNAGVTTIDSSLFAMQSVGGSVGAELRGASLTLLGDLSFAGTYAVANTNFAGSSVVIPTLATPYDTVYVSGTAQLATPLAANAFFVIGSGAFELAGNRVDVTGDFGTLGTGTFRMTEPADTLMVGGSFYASGGSTSGLLTDGLLQVGGNFIQGTYIPCCVEIIVAGPLPAFDAFNADTGHVTRLTGGLGARFIYFSNPLDPFAPPGSSSKFGALELIDGIDSLYSTVPVAGTTTIASGELYDGTLAAVGSLTVFPGVTTLSLSSLYSGGGIDYQAAPSTFNVSETFFFGGDSIPVLPYQWLRVGFATMALTSDLAVQQVTVGGQGEGPTDSYGGTLDLNGRTLATSGNVTLTGHGVLRMGQPTDSLDVGGNFNSQSGAETGLLTDGVIYARADVYLSPNWSDTGFVASGNHRLVMAAPASAQLWVSNGPTGVIRVNKYFVPAGTTVDFNAFSSGALVVNDTFSIAGSFLQAAPGKSVIALGDAYIGTSVNFVVDTLELHRTLDVDFSTYNVKVTKYAGTGQTVFSGVTYQGLEVSGTAALENLTTATFGTTIRGGGQLAIGPWTLVTPTLSVIDTATLAMTNATSAVDVSGDVLFDGGPSSGLLTGGRLTVGGSFTSTDGPLGSTFAATATEVTFNGTGVPQVVTITDGSFSNFRAVGITNPFGIQINGLMVVTDSVGTAGPIVGDSLYQFGNFFLNPGAQISLKVLKTAGLFSGTPASYAVGRTHITNANSLPNVPFDTLVVNATNVYALYPITANALIVAGTGSNYGFGGGASLDLGINDFPLAHAVAGDLRIEGSNASLEIAEDTVNVGGDFYTSLGGTLSMNGPGALLVSGSTLFGGGSQSGLLTNGTLQVGSGITQQAFSSPSSFRMDGTTLDFPVGPVHVINIETPDSSWLPDISSGAAGTLALIINGRARVAGGISGYGVSLSGDSLWIDGLLTGGPGSATASPAELRVGQLDQFGNFGSFVVGTGHITGPGALPFNLDPTFDSLFVHDSVQGQLSQIITTKYLEVTGPGNPRSLTGVPGRFNLIGGDGFTDVVVNGDVTVRGAGAAIVNNQGRIAATGSLTVDQDAYLGATGGLFDGIFDIDGDVLIDGASTRDSLVSGTLVVGGKFTQAATSNSESFAPSPDFVTRFKFGGSHAVAFATPSPAGGGGSYFGTLEFGSDAGLVVQTDTDLWVEGFLVDTAFGSPTLQNTAAGLRTITVRDVSIQGIAFDHLQLHLESTTAPTTAGMDIVTFQNFLTSEDQFLVTLPGQAAGGYTWSNFTWTQLATDGSDSGRYIVATDSDGVFPFLDISIGSNQRLSGELVYYVGLNGATVTPFAP